MLMPPPLPVPFGEAQRDATFRPLIHSLLKPHFSKKKKKTVKSIFPRPFARRTESFGQPARWILLPLSLT